MRSPDGNIGYDASGRANGRGAYVCRDLACIAKAVAGGGLGRTFEAPIPAELRAALEAAADHSINEAGGARGKE